MKFFDLFKLVYCFYFPLIVFLFNLVLVVFGVYDVFPWLDIPMHFVGGASIAYSFILVFRSLKKEVIVKEKFLKVILIFAFVCVAAVFWEFGEFLADYFFNWGLQVSLEDTIIDLFLGLFGGLVTAIFGKT